MTARPIGPASMLYHYEATNTLDQETELVIAGDFTIDVGGTFKVKAGKHQFFFSSQMPVPGFAGVGSIMFNTPQDAAGNPVLITQKFIPYKDRASTILLRKRLSRHKRCGCGG